MLDETRTPSKNAFPTKTSNPTAASIVSNGEADVMLDRREVMVESTSTMDVDRTTGAITAH